MNEGIDEQIQRIKITGAVRALTKEIEFSLTQRSFRIAAETAKEIVTTIEEYIKEGGKGD